MGNSVGSECGEGYYSLAVKVGHTPACISFENYAGRPAALWAESVKTPERLRIGSGFTWAGEHVEVTNMKQDHLIACTYKRDRHDRKFGVGSSVYADSAHRQVEQFSESKAGMLLRLGPPVPEDSRTPERIFKIPYAELQAKRKTYDAARRQALKDIAATETPADLQAVLDRLAAMPRNTFRHFDVEDFRVASDQQKKGFDRREVEKQEALREGERLERWLAGEGSGYFRVVRLRVKGPWVETSTGHSVAVKSARRVLPMVLSRRKKFGAVHEPLDVHEIREFNATGVLVGCTLIPWGEVERIAGELSCA